MPPATKRRRVATTTSPPLTAPAAQRGIQSFGKISKSQVRDPEKRVPGKSSTAAHSKDGSRSETSKKRKFGSICSPTVKEGVERASSLGEQAPTIDDSSSKPVDTTNNSPKATPTRTKNLQKKASPNVETPTKGTRSCLESLALASFLPSDSSSSSPTTDHETPPSSPASAKSESTQHHETYPLPDELQDLVNLHSSFLTALSLHYAHNGSRTPADLRNLGPGIERAWRKRRVTLDDVRRIMAIGRGEGADGHEIAGTLYLSDYGYGKICVEIAEIPDSKRTKRRPINEEALNSVFLRDLEQRWMCYKNDNPTDHSPSNFLASLALSPITPCTSLSKIAPLLSKGQRRLEDLKTGAIKAQQKPLSITSANPNSIAQSKTMHTSARSTDLFSRLKAKQLHQSTLPLPPSAEALARKSALQRLHKITPVLQSLVVSSEKHSNDDAAAVGVTPMASPMSFTMPTLVQHLQMSLRNPIGKEEVIRSIRLLEEVAPEWVVLKEVGKMHGVTIKGAGLRRDELGKRIESLLGKL